MSFPASTELLSSSLANACGQARRVKDIATTLRTASAVGDVPRTNLIFLMQQLSTAIAIWNQTAALSGIAAYAQAQLGNGSLNVATEFTSMVNAATALRDWIFTNFPKDAGSGAWLTGSFNNAGTLTELVFTTAQLAQFRANVDTFVATIS
jgi:hypothetical protein